MFCFAEAMGLPFGSSRIFDVTPILGPPCTTDPFEIVTVSSVLRAAAVLCWVSAVGFGVFTLPAIARVWVGKDIPIVMGFPAYGRGPFENFGISSTVPLLAGFLAVCVLEGVAGWLLWEG